MGASAEILSASLGILAYARGVRRKDCGSAEDVLLRSAEVSKRKVRKPITNDKLATSGVARCCHEATSERGRGWVGYLPLNHNARSEASEHAFALVAIPRQDPKHQPPHFGAHFCSGCTTRARRPFELLHRCCFATSLGWLFAVKRIVTALDTGIENVPFFVGATSEIALKHLIR